MNDHPNVEPHGALEALFDDIFRVTGSVVMMPLMRISRNMVVVRSGESLTLFHAVRLNEDGLDALDALGKVDNVVRIGMHGMDDAFYVDRYQARLWALPGVTHASGRTTDRELTPDALPLSDATLFQFEHTVKPEAALLIARHGGLLITCDSVQHWEPMPFATLPARLAIKVMGFDRPAQIGPPWRKAMTPPGGTLRPDFERLAALPFAHLIGAHGGLARDNAPDLLRATIERVFGPA